MITTPPISMRKILIILMVSLYSSATFAASPCTLEILKTGDNSECDVASTPENLKDAAVDYRVKNFAGFDPLELRDIFNIVKKEAAEKNAKALSKLVQYPIRYSFSGKNSKAKNQIEFIHKFKLIFNSKVIDAITAQKYGDLFVNWRGAMIGNGEIWFIQNKDEPIKIIVNN